MRTQRSVKIGEFFVNSHHVLLLALLTFDVDELDGAPSAMDVRVLIDGNVDDDVYFVLDWAHLQPLCTVDRIGKPPMEVNEDLLGPRTPNSGA